MGTFFQVCILFTLLSPNLASACLDGKCFPLYIRFFLCILLLCITAQAYQKNIVAQEYQLHFCAFSLGDAKKLMPLKNELA